MNPKSYGRTGQLAWGVASLTMPGEAQSGDTFVVGESSQGTLVGVVDGLGHGMEAAAAGLVVAAALSDFADESILSLFKRCNQAAQKTRGVVMSLASFSKTDSLMTWAGVGNVEGLLVRANPNATPSVERLLLRAGGVGFNLPEMKVAVIPILPGDILILATDGIRNDFPDSLNPYPSDAPQKIAEKILAKYKKDTDDALVLVARYGGGGNEHHPQ